MNMSAAKKIWGHYMKILILPFESIYTAFYCCFFYACYITPLEKNLKWTAFIILEQFH